MDQIELEATKRDVLGKKVRFLRRQGITPVHVFGHGIESATLQCDTAKLQRGLARAGQTGLINLTLDYEKKPRRVIVREVQLEPRTGKLLHVDFYQVKMGEKVNVEVPVVLIGEAPALKEKENTLVHDLTTLNIDCLPDKIPASIELDISSLTEADQALRVKDIELDEGVTILNDPEVVLTRISARREEKVEEEVITEEAEGEEAEAAEAPEAAAEETKE
ncbi:50S ribosomal protein L25 [Chloroflexota bacterium]